MILGARRAQLPAIRSALNMGLNVIAIDPDPVSYTHLDVYKRQLLLHDRSIRRLLVPAFTYIILMAPQIIIVAKGRLATPDFSSVDQTIQDNRLSFMFTRIVVERRWAT